MPNPEELARQEIDALLGPCGWTVQDKNGVILGALGPILVKGAIRIHGQSGISNEDSKNLPISFGFFTEQQRIVAEVERRLSVVEELEAVLNANLQRATHLRRSILQRAFQDALYEGGSQVSET